jgi:hypothetical protein
LNATRLIVNWFGLAGGVATIAVIIFSVLMGVPWWQLAIGHGVGQINVSPLRFGFDLLGDPVSLPLIFFLNLVSLLLLTMAAAGLLVYSIIPNRKYSKQLLGFAYKKPLYTVVLFIGSLLVATVAVGNFLEDNIPISGEATLLLPASISQGAKVSVPIVTGFTWVFYLVLAATVFCIAARFYDKRIASLHQL